MEKYKKIYRISSARLQDWNYGEQGAYFVTICTRNRKHFFGEIIDDQMHLSDIGIIVRQEWLQTPLIRPDMNITLDDFVVMPNHFHGIVIIGENKYNYKCITPNKDLLPMNQFAPQSKNLSSIIRGFKSSITTYARDNNIPFDWQARFYDHIIRNDKEMSRIRHYIVNNVTNWKNDKFF